MHVIGIVLGTRPEIIKLAPLVWELRRRRLDFRVIHTGQHYDYEMSELFFEELALGEPDFFLGALGGTDAKQTAEIMTGLESLLSREGVSKVVVEGDTNSVLAGSIVAKKQKRILAHVEAGARSFDRTMPEEVNLIVCDHLSDLLFAPSEPCVKNLLDEKIPRKRIMLSGNTQLETLDYALKKNRPPQFSVPKEFALVTVHRQENVSREKLAFLAKMLSEIPREKIFPAHPRTKKAISSFGLEQAFGKAGVSFQKPVGYLELVWLAKRCGFAITDSGGLQKEAAALGKPVIIPRSATEWPEIIASGHARLVGLDAKSGAKAKAFLRSFSPKKIREVGGKPSARIADALMG